MRREESLGYLVNHVARQLARALHDEIAPFGVVPGQFAQLLALYERDGLTQQELCEAVQVEQPTMANTVRRMERDGLVVREPHPTDGRKQLIRLTDRARELEAALKGAARRVNARACRDLTEDRAAALVDALRTVRASLDEDASRITR